MTFAELREHVQSLPTDRIPQALSEMIACEHLARFLNRTTGTNYDRVSKDFDLEDDGVDAKIFEHDNDATTLYIQVTRSREYEMSPEFSEHPLTLTGQPIVDALEHKCFAYQKRGVYTQKIALLIVGVTPPAIIRELLERPVFRAHFEQTTCFDGIYYVTGESVVDLVAGRQ